MQTLQFKTNINCQNCVAKVTPYLNEQEGVTNWQVDTQNPDKILTISGENLVAEEIIGTIQKAGFKVNSEIHSAMTAASAAIHTKTESDFWADRNVWKRASKNTLNCLIGCTAGDFGMMIYLQTQHPDMNMWLVMSLAMATGLFTSVLLETVLLHFNEKFVWSQALQTALSMSFLSMLVMELAENMTDLLLTGGQFHAHNPYYWFALSISAVMGFVVPLPYNYFKLKKYNKACH
jgi:cation transport ATPase